MKDSLFEMLLNLFEKTLSQLKEKQQTEPKVFFPMAERRKEIQLEFLKPAKETSLRVFTHDETAKLTKPSYQFLMRLMTWGMISQGAIELVINKLMLSQSRFVSLQETKWTLRTTLSESLDAEQLAFLDLILYQKEDKLALH